MWSRVPHVLHLLGRPRGLRGLCPRPLCEPRPAATNAEMGGGDVSGAGAPGASDSSSCRRVTRKCHHRESNPAPPCPEPYAVTKYRA
jgi:hypothetical protein